LPLLLLSITTDALVDGHLTASAKVFAAPAIASARDGGLVF